MLFGYPIQATENNWLHDCFYKIIKTIHEKLESNTEIPKWPDIIPDKHREILKTHRGLKDRLLAYINAIGSIEPIERQRVFETFVNQNKIKNLLSCECDCLKISDLHQSVRSSILDLAKFFFELLTTLKIRDSHYSIIYNSLKIKNCPFCGYESFDAPSAPREDYDHYLAVSIYPFAAANLYNLVPMGGKCNKTYKKSVDILYDDTGNRRRAFNPYDHQPINISLRDSNPFSEENNLVPLWKIDFYPNSTECETWDCVFKIRERYVRDILNQSYNNWLGNFANWFINKYKIDNISDDKITESINEYRELLELQELSGQEFFRFLVFDMLYVHCRDGSERLSKFLHDIINSLLSQRAA